MVKDNPYPNHNFDGLSGNNNITKSETDSSMAMFLSQPQQ
jgi:hypothetical protein